MGTILSVRDLAIQVNKRELMHNISFDLHEGDVLLLSGANGIGKSTLLKSILCLETAGKKISGDIICSGFGSILQLDSEAIQKFRSHVAYVQQKDDYSEMGTVQVKDIISECNEAYSGKAMSYAEVNDLIDEWLPRRENNSRIFDAKSKPSKFSGGEQRLLSVFSVLATRPTAPLIIIDEPLNNLDFVNARSISNLINRVVREHTSTGLLMISHCRIFPFITREIKLSTDGVFEIPTPYACHSCFGDHDSQGYYF